jgi:hypothetical protein
LLQHPRINPNAQGNFKDTALNTASYSGHVEIVRLLLQHPHTNNVIAKQRKDTEITTLQKKQIKTRRK